MHCFGCSKKEKLLMDRLGALREANDKIRDLEAQVAAMKAEGLGKDIMSLRIKTLTQKNRLLVGGLEWYSKNSKDPSSQQYVDSLLHRYSEIFEEK